MNPLITSGKNLPSGKDLPCGSAKSPGLGPSKRPQSVKEPMIQGSSKTSRERELEESKQKSIASVKEEIKQLKNESEIEREKVELTYGLGSYELLAKNRVLFLENLNQILKFLW